MLYDRAKRATTSEASRERSEQLPAWGLGGAVSPQEHFQFRDFSGHFWCILGAQMNT